MLSRSCRVYVVVTKQYRLRPVPVNTIQEFLRLWTNLEGSQQAEKNRRLAWEKEQEARWEENERRFRTMQKEIDSLKEHIRHVESGTTTVSTASQNSVPEVSRDLTPFQDFPQDHTPNQDASYPLFVQGSSTDPAPYNSNGILDSLVNTDENVPYTRKRTTSPSSGDDESSEDDELSSAQRPSKRINGHDTRCLTIQVHRVILFTGLCC